MSFSLFSDLHSLSELSGDINKIIERRVHRKVISEFIAYSKWLEMKALIERFNLEPYAFEKASQHQNAVLRHFEKMVKDKPEIPYLRHLFGKLVEEVEDAEEILEGVIDG